MQEFHGIYKDMYSCVFGTFRLVQGYDPDYYTGTWYEICFTDITIVDMNSCFDMRAFPNKYKALAFVLKKERLAKETLKVLLEI